MEDPIKFDLWGKILAGERDRALSVLRSHKLYDSELELRKTVQSAVRCNAPVRVSSAMGYTEVTAFAGAVSSIFAELAVYQEGWTPHDKSQYCEQHDLHYGGCLGCHVCSGFYIR